MAQREIDPKLKELFDRGEKVYSISKLNNIDTCEYQAYLTYVKKHKGLGNCYNILGSQIHDCLEKIMNGLSDESELPTVLKKELADIDRLGIDFPSDRNGNSSIKDNWIADMSDFCNSFVKPKGQFETEQLFIYKTPEGAYLQGYIDLIRHNRDGSISIFDWKTSSQFSLSDLKHHGRQLVLYALGKEQEGYNVKSVAWIMLKYAEVSFWGKARKNSKNETLIKKVCNRSKIANELKPYIESDLEKLGYSELDIELMVNEAVKANSLSKLPEEIQKKYTIKPYVRKYELTDEIKQETLNYIKDKISQFESKSDDENDWAPIKITDKNSFYCNNLCGYRKECRFIATHNAMKSGFYNTKNDDLF